MLRAAEPAEHQNRFRCKVPRLSGALTDVSCDVCYDDRCDVILALVETSLTSVRSVVDTGVSLYRRLRATTNSYFSAKNQLVGSSSFQSCLHGETLGVPKNFNYDDCSRL